MKIKPAVFIFIIIIVFVFNCGKSDETYTIEIKDGVNYVHNKAPLWGDTLKVALEFVQQIGVFEGPDENYMFFKPYDIEKDSNGNLYVLDYGNYRVQKFDHDLKYLATFGRRGYGPSEFEDPLIINVNNEGNLLVGCSYGMAYPLIIEFDQNGREIRRFKLEGSDTGRIIILNSGNIVARAESKTSLVSILDSDGRLLRQFGEKKVFGDRLFMKMVNQLYFTSDERDNIYLVYSFQNKIEKYSPEDKLIYRADRPLNYKESTKPGKDSWNTNYNNISNLAYIDIHKRLWTATYIYQSDPDKDQKPSEYVHFEIFDLEGILLGYLPFPERNTLYFEIFGDRLYLIDFENEMCIYEYKIVEK